MKTSAGSRKMAFLFLERILIEYIGWPADSSKLVRGTGTVTSGIVTGVNGEGELLLREGDEEVPIIAGEISLIGTRKGT